MVTLIFVLYDCTDRCFSKKTNRLFNNGSFDCYKINFFRDTTSNFFPDTLESTKAGGGNQIKIFLLNKIENGKMIK